MAPPTTTLNIYTVRLGRELRNIEGRTAADALATLDPADRDRVVLISDDADLIFSPRTRPAVLPNARLASAIHAKGGVRWFALAVGIALKLWPLWVFGALVALAYSGGRSTSAFAKYLIVFIIFAAAFMIWKVARMTHRARALDLATANQDWPRVLKLCEQIAAGVPASNRPTAERSCARYRIRALVALKRDAEALEYIERCAADPEVRPEATLYLRAVYHCWRNDAIAELDAYRQLTIECPHYLLGWLTYAEKLAIEHDRPAEARTAIDFARTLPIAEAKLGQLDLIEGLVRVSEGRDQDAINSFTAARQALPADFTPKAAIASVAPGSVAACMAIAHARLGHTAHAIAELNRAHGMLRHHPRPQLLERAQREVAACEQRAIARA